MIFIASVSKDDGNFLWIIQVLRLIAEVIEETIGIDKMRENQSAIAMTFDLLLVDAGLPLLASKPLL